MALNIRPVVTRDFSWDVGFQFATNRNRVLDLAGVQFVPLPISGGTNGLTIQVWRSKDNRSVPSMRPTSCGAAAA